MKNIKEEITPCPNISKIPPQIDCLLNLKTPNEKRDIWLTLERAIIDFKSFWP